MAILRQKGFSLIEILLVSAVILILVIAIVFVAQKQLLRARDARRKADLDKLQNSLEDYLNDNLCYPDSLTCDSLFAPYLSRVPCDPKNNLRYNYFYSYDQNEVCKSWYKIYTKLENFEDPIIEEKGCPDGCGPSSNYNFWVSSANVADASQMIPGEEWWSPIPGVTPTPGGSPGGTPSPSPQVSPSPSPSPQVSPSPGVWPTPSPPPCPGGWYACQSGVCNATTWESPLWPKWCNDPCCGHNCCCNSHGCTWQCF